MKLAGLQFPVFNPYNQPTIEIYISGCNKTCDGCCSPELKDFDYGDELVLDVIGRYFAKNAGMYDVVSVLGGDLLEQDETEAEEFSKYLRTCLAQKGIKMWLFTGHNDVPDWCKLYYDVIKYGEYDKSKGQGVFPSSSNQTVIYKGKDY